MNSDEVLVFNVPGEWILFGMVVCILMGLAIIAYGDAKKKR